MGVELSGPADPRTPLQKPRQTPLMKRVGAGLYGRSQAQRKEAVRQHHRDRGRKEYVDVTREGYTGSHTHDPDEGEDGTEGE